MFNIENSNRAKESIKTIGLAAATCTAEMLGGGIVSLPYIVTNTYILTGAIMIIFGALLTYYTGWLLSELYIDICADLDLNQDNNFDVDNYDHDDRKKNEKNPRQSIQREEPLLNKQHKLSPYLQIADHIWPKYGKYILGFCVGITLIFVDILFLVLCGMNLLSMIGDDTKLTQTTSIIIFAVGTLLVSYLWGQVKHYQFFVWLAVISSFIAIILSYPVIIKYAPSHPSLPSMSSAKPINYATAYGTIMFSFGGHAGFPT